MKLVISTIDADDGQALVSLYRWLSRDSTVASHGQLTVQTVGQRPGDMGGAVDVINALFSDAGAAAGVGSMLVAYCAWRSTRTRAPAFKIEKDGITVVVEQGSEQETKQILDAMFPEAHNAGPTETTRENPGRS